MSYVFAFVFVKPILLIWFFFEGLRYLPHRKKLPKTPALFIGNHHSNWDGLYAAIYYYWIFPHFMVHEDFFKTRWLSFLSGWLIGQINREIDPYALQPIRTMKRYLEQRKNVFLFPEGDIDMFGQQLPIDLALAKLVKWLDRPVVLFQVQGAYFRAPRWASKSMKAPLSIQTIDVLSREQVRTLSLLELQEHLVSSIRVESYALKLPVKIRNSHRAEKLERGLFWCPQCHRFNSLVTSRTRLRCTSCTLEVEVSEQLTFRWPEGSPVSYGDPTHWNHQQLAALAQHIEFHAEDQSLFSGEFLMAESKAYDYIARPKRSIALVLNKNGLRIASGGVSFDIAMGDIRYYRLVAKDQFECRTEEKRYLFAPKRGTAFGYFWVQTLNLLMRRSV